MIVDMQVEAILLWPAESSVLCVCIAVVGTVEPQALDNVFETCISFPGWYLMV